MVVYLDLIFLTNLLIDGAVLLTTAWARKIRAKFWRIFAASWIGAFYVIFMIFPSMTFLYTFLVKLLLSVFMLITAFGFGSMQHFLRNLGVFYCVNFVAAGGVLGLHYLLQSSGEVLNGIWFSRTGSSGFPLQISLTVALFALPAALVLYRTVWASVKRRELLAQYFAEVKVWIDGLEHQCTGLVDTGNQLYDPLTRTPVMIMEASAWPDKIPDRWLEWIRKAEADRIFSGAAAEDGEQPFAWQDRLRLVPFRGINRSMQFMLAIKPDKVVIEFGERRTETSKVLIGLDGGKLSADGSYRAIVHPGLVDEGLERSE